MLDQFRFIPRRLTALSLAALLALTPVSAVEGEQPAAIQPDVSQPAVSQPAVSQPEEEPSQVVPLVLPDSVAQAGDFSRVSQYLRYLPQLVEKGYTQQEADLLFSRIGTTRIMSLLRREYTPVAAQAAAQPHFRSANLERYLSYQTGHPDLTVEQVVTHVNMGLDYPFYTNIRAARPNGEHGVLVNKYNRLGASYQPELTLLGGRYASYTAYMEPTACEWFVKMVDAAYEEDIWLYCVSAYRSYAYQGTLYQRYVRQSGEAGADRYSARPGYSEHQTGLAVDINVASSSAHFEQTKQYQWLQEHCWEYGFILRYPEGKEHITGFKFEPWHYRYVGRDTALAIRDSGLTYDEYMASQPTQAGQQADALAVGESVFPLSRPALLLGSTHFVPAEDLAGALGMAYALASDGRGYFTGDGITLSVKREEKTAAFTLTLPGNGAEATLEGELKLSSTPFIHNGVLLVPLEELAALLELSIVQNGNVLTLAAPLPTLPTQPEPKEAPQSGAAPASTPV